MGIFAIVLTKCYYPHLLIKKWEMFFFLFFFWSTEPLLFIRVTAVSATVTEQFRYIAKDNCIKRFIFIFMQVLGSSKY